MQHDLGVGFRLEDRALLLQRLPKFTKILDDAVVDDGDALGRMRVGIVLGRPPVGSPAGVTDAGMTCERFGAQPRLEVFQLAFGAPAFEMLAFQRGDTSGIVTAIFKTLERIHQLLRDRSASQNADNAAHAVQYPQIAENSPKPRHVLLTRNADVQILNNYCRLRQS